MQTSCTRRHRKFQISTISDTIPADAIPAWSADSTPRTLDVSHASIHKTRGIANNSDPTSYAMLVSDGSVKNSKGTYGWVQTDAADQVMTGNGHVLGTPSTMSSYQAEAQGAASCLLNLMHHNVVKAKFFSDNESLVKQVQKTRRLHPLQPDWELVEPVRKFANLHQMPTQHVKGHQNPQNPKTPYEAHLNIQADELANQAHSQHHETEPYRDGYGIILEIAGRPITAKYAQEIQHAATTPAVRDYYRRHHAWSDATMASMDWQAFYDGQKCFTVSDRQKIHKYVHELLPTGDNINIRYNYHQPCPHCGQSENRDHLLMCSYNRPYKEKFIEHMENQLIKKHTEPGLRRLIIDTL